MNPHTGKMPHAVVQLRQDNAAGTLYNLVGFQTHLEMGRAEASISLNSWFGAMQNLSVMVLCIAIHLLIHLSCLKPTYQFKRRENLFFAGQMTGVEGYVESAASGLIAGLNAGRLAKG